MLEYNSIEVYHCKNIQLIVMQMNTYIIDIFKCSGIVMPTLGC